MTGSPASREASEARGIALIRVALGLGDTNELGKARGDVAPSLKGGDFGDGKLTIVS